MVLAHVAFSIAYVVIVVSARLRTVSPALEEAAMDLGANVAGLLVCDAARACARDYRGALFAR